MPATIPLTDDEREFLASAREATLATISPEGLPRLVPICFVVETDSDGRPVVFSALDEKPKQVWDIRDLARARDIVARPDVALLVDRWSEDWSQLGWLRVAGTASVFEPAQAPGEHAAAVTALRAKYPQYETHRLEARPLIRIAVTGARSWGNLAGQRSR